jgi:hypothetical protein
MTFASQVATLLPEFNHTFHALQSRINKYQPFVAVSDVSAEETPPHCITAAQDTLSKSAAPLCSCM